LPLPAEVSQKLKKFLGTFGIIFGEPEKVVSSDRWLQSELLPSHDASSSDASTSPGPSMNTNHWAGYR
jgi:hypothetical protein